jgi:hypothetical protein
MRVTVDQAGQQAATLQIELAGARGRQRIEILVERNNPASADEHMTDTEVFGREDPGVG